MAKGSQNIEDVRAVDPEGLLLPPTLLCALAFLAQFRVLRKKGTEPGGSGTYDKFYEDGTYKCAGCGAELYK